MDENPIRESMRFHTLISFVDGRREDMNSFYEEQIDSAKSRFSRIITNLEGMLEGNRVVSVHDLFDVTRILGRNLRLQSPEYIKEVIGQLKKAIKYSDELKTDPSAFYKDENAVMELSKIYNKLYLFSDSKRYIPTSSD